MVVINNTKDSRVRKCAYCGRRFKTKYKEQICCCKTHLELLADKKGILNLEPYGSNSKKYSIKEARHDKEKLQDLWKGV